MGSFGSSCSKFSRQKLRVNTVMRARRFLSILGVVAPILLAAQARMFETDLLLGLGNAAPMKTGPMAFEATSCTSGTVEQILLILIESLVASGMGTFAVLVV